MITAGVLIGVMTVVASSVLLAVCVVDLARAYVRLGRLERRASALRARIHETLGML